MLTSISSLSPAYGCTELSGPCVQSGVRDTTLPLSAAGTLIANTEMRFLDLNGADVGAKGPGEITVRGPNVMMYVLCIYRIQLIDWNSPIFEIATFLERERKSVTADYV